MSGATALPQRVQMQYMNSQTHVSCRSVSNLQLGRWCAVIYYFTSKDEDNEKARALFVFACAVSCAEIQRVIGVLGLARYRLSFSLHILFEVDIRSVAWKGLRIALLYHAGQIL